MRYADWEDFASVRNLHRELKKQNKIMPEFRVEFSIHKNRGGAFVHGRWAALVLDDSCLESAEDFEEAVATPLVETLFSRRFMKRVVKELKDLHKRLDGEEQKRDRQNLR